MFNFTIGWDHGLAWWKLWRISEHLWIRRIARCFTGQRSSAIAQEMLPRYLYKKRRHDAADLWVTARYGRLRYVNSDVYWDSRFGLELRHKGRIVAVLGFDSRLRGIEITQLQGVSGMHRALRHFRWEQFLIDYLMKVLETSMPDKSVRIMIRPAKKIWWYHWYVSDKSSPTSLFTLRRRLRRRYDGTAQKLGFVYSRWFKRWVNYTGTGRRRPRSFFSIYMLKSRHHGRGTCSS